MLPLVALHSVVANARSRHPGALLSAEGVAVHLNRHFITCGPDAAALLLREPEAPVGGDAIVLNLINVTIWREMALPRLGVEPTLRRAQFTGGLLG